MRTSVPGHRSFVLSFAPLRPLCLGPRARHNLLVQFASKRLSQPRRSTCQTLFFSGDSRNNISLFFLCILGVRRENDTPKKKKNEPMSHVRRSHKGGTGCFSFLDWRPPPEGTRERFLACARFCSSIVCDSNTQCCLLIDLFLRFFPHNPNVVSLVVKSCYSSTVA